MIDQNTNHQHPNFVNFNKLKYSVGQFLNTYSSFLGLFQQQTREEFVRSQAKSIFDISIKNNRNIDDVIANFRLYNSRDSESSGFKIIEQVILEIEKIHLRSNQQKLPQSDVEFKNHQKNKFIRVNEALCEVAREFMRECEQISATTHNYYQSSEYSENYYEQVSEVANRLANTKDPQLINFLKEQNNLRSSNDFKKNFIDEVLNHLELNPASLPQEPYPQTTPKSTDIFQNQSSSSQDSESDFFKKSFSEEDYKNFLGHKNLINDPKNQLYKVSNLLAVINQTSNYLNRQDLIRATVELLESFSYQQVSNPLPRPKPNTKSRFGITFNDSEKTFLLQLMTESNTRSKKNAAQILLDIYNSKNESNSTKLSTLATVRE